MKFESLLFLDADVFVQDEFVSFAFLHQVLVNLLVFLHYRHEFVPLLSKFMLKSLGFESLLGQLLFVVRDLFVLDAD